MFESLSLYNFQNHKKLYLEFDKFLTTLIGPSDAGKTAVIRALRMLCLNPTMRGTYVRHGRKRLKIILRVDGHVIVRTKGEQENIYKLDGAEYRSFGAAAVPEDISKILNVDTDNFRRQFDLPFWFSETAGQVSKNLNQIVNLGEIDKVLQITAADLRRARSEEEVSRSRLEDARQKEEELSWVPEYVQRVEKLSALHDKMVNARERAHSLQSLLGAVASHTHTKDLAARAIIHGTKAVSIGKAAARKARQAKELRTCLEEADRITQLINTPLPDIGPLLALRKKGDAKAEQRRELEALIDSYTLAKRELCHTTTKLETAEKTLKKRTPKKCPTCGQTLSPSSVLTFTSHTSHQYSDPKSRTGMGQ